MKVESLLATLHQMAAEHMDRELGVPGFPYLRVLRARAGSYSVMPCLWHYRGKGHTLTNPGLNSVLCGSRQTSNNALLSA